MSVSRDQQALTVWAPGGYTANYSIKDNTWTPLAVTAAASNGTLSARSGFQAVTDPTTVLVYILRVHDGNNMLVVNPANHQTAIIAMPQTPTLFNWGHSSFVWSELTSSFFLFGGRHESVAPYFWEYSPSTKSWTEPTSGSVPGPSTASCMVSARKILLGDLHVFDVRTLVWTKEHAVDPTENRSHMACAVGGDSFIVWGDQPVLGLIFAYLTFSRWRHQEQKQKRLTQAVQQGIQEGLQHQHHQQQRHAFHPAPGPPPPPGMELSEVLSNNTSQGDQQGIPVLSNEIEIQSPPMEAATYTYASYSGPNTTFSSPAPWTLYPPPIVAQSSSLHPYSSPSPIPLAPQFNPGVSTPTAMSHPYPANPQNTQDQQYLIRQQQHPQLYVDDPSLTPPPPQRVRNLQDRNEPKAEAENPQEIARQIRVMQAELQRLQSKLGV
ncbi:hypothetical protein BGX23_006511 [Mortierella sp. AD031]|nr:hypothetical protein BGX23_006511 [Mortierella sp. AD031]